MTQEDKKLLLIDLCARLPYYTELYSNVADGNWAILTPVVISNLMSATDKLVIKPYLRPMSSMTDEEYKEYSKLWDLQNEFPTDIDIRFKTDVFDWLNAHHFDYRGLIPMGLALEAPNEIYNN